MRLINKVLISAAIYNHFDKKIYSAQEVADEVKRCSDAGASVAHFHIAKVKGGVEGFLTAAQMIKENSGTFLDISVADYNQLLPYKNICYKNNIRHVAMYGASCIVFGKKFEQSFNRTVMIAGEYLENGFIPEVCIFSKEGVYEVKKLNNIFPKCFFASLYLGYPDGIEAIPENILWACTELSDCLFTRVAIFNNQEDSLLKTTIQSNSHIRVGVEDIVYDENKLAVDNISVIRKVSRLVYKSGKSVATSDDISV